MPVAQTLPAALSSALSATPCVETIPNRKRRASDVVLLDPHDAADRDGFRDRCHFSLSGMDGVEAPLASVDGETQMRVRLLELAGVAVFQQYLAIERANAPVTPYHLTVTAHHQ